MIKKKITRSSLERVNRNPRSRTENNIFLDRYFKMIKTALYLRDKGKLTETKMRFEFIGRQGTAKNIIRDMREGINVFTNIDFEIYAMLQSILCEVNGGKPMRMDLFIEIIITWFIHTYYNNIQNMTKDDPFYVPKEVYLKKKTEKRRLLKHFNDEFSQYYINIVKS